MNKAHLKQEEKQRLIAEIRQREEDGEKAKEKQQKLLRKLDKMKDKIMCGNQAIEVCSTAKITTTSDLEFKVSLNYFKDAAKSLTVP